MPYEPRTYRAIVAPEGLVTFEVAIKETDLQISAVRDLTSEAEDLIAQVRWEIESYIAAHPRFAETWAPYEVEADAPGIVRQMAKAAFRARVGPMAAVAGATSEFVARGLAEHSPEVIVENGGDIFMVGERDRTIATWADRSSLTAHLGILVKAGLMPVAVCTSSGTVGHSTSLGSADAAVVLAHDGALADAVATALANRVHTAEDIQRAIDATRGIHGVLGLVVVLADHVGAWGNVHLTALE